MEAHPYRRLSDPAPAPAGAWDFEAGAARLLSEITAVCDGEKNFPQRVQAGLRATLELFADEPELGLLLTAHPPAGDELAIRRQQRWQERFGDLLRVAASRSPGAAAHPPFLEPFLVAGIRWQIASRLISDGDGERLEDLLPDLMEFVLSCYLDSRDATASPAQS